MNHPERIQADPHTNGGLESKESLFGIQYADVHSIVGWSKAIFCILAGRTSELYQLFWVYQGTSGLTVIWCQRFAFTPCELRQRRGLLAGWNAHEPRGECAQPSRHLAALRKPSFRKQMFNGTRNRTHRFITFVVGICFNPIYSLFISLSYRACCWNRGVPFLWGALELWVIRRSSCTSPQKSNQSNQSN